MISNFVRSDPIKVSFESGSNPPNAVQICGKFWDTQNIVLQILRHFTSKFEFKKK